MTTLGLAGYVLSPRVGSTAPSLRTTPPSSAVARRHASTPDAAMIFLREHDIVEDGSSRPLGETRDVLAATGAPRPGRVPAVSGHPVPPVLAVEDVESAAAWWRDHLGFDVRFVHRAPDPDSTPTNYAVVGRDDVEVHLARRAEISDRQPSEITITVADLDALVDELAARSTATVQPRTGTTPAAVVGDPSGNRIVFRPAG